MPDNGWETIEIEPKEGVAYVITDGLTWRCHSCEFEINLRHSDRAEEIPKIKTHLIDEHQAKQICIINVFVMPPKRSEETDTPIVKNNQGDQLI